MIIGRDIERAATVLRDGGLAAFATETVYGLGADARNESAVARVYEAKARPRFDPLIVHVAEWRDVEALVLSVPDAAAKLAAHFWPGPLTLVLEKSPVIPDLVTSGLPTVAVRIPAHPQARELLKTAGVPVAAPSANAFGRISPTTAAHVAESLGDRVDYILDGGPCAVGIESTVLDVTTPVPQLLRPGGLEVEALEAVLGTTIIRTNAASQDATAHPAPGMLLKHYAPRTPLDIVPTAEVESHGGSRTGLLCFEKPSNAEDAFSTIEVLSISADLREAAANFFAALRRLDAADLDHIIATPFPKHGLGIALNDRLTRAAARDET